MARRRGSDDEPIDDAVERLGDDIARQLLARAATTHDDVERAVRLAAAGNDDRIAVLTTAVDDSLRTRRFLDYWQTTAWANDAQPVVDALAAEVATHPSTELVKLLERAAGHLVKVILKADDSNGEVGGL